MREKSTIAGVLSLDSMADKQGGAQQDKNKDDHHLDHGKPIFKCAEVPHLAKINKQEQGGIYGDPNQGRNLRQPEARVSRRGHQLTAD